MFNLLCHWIAFARLVLIVVSLTVHQRIGGRLFVDGRFLACGYAELTAVIKQRLAQRSHSGG
jgi:hypothetical protein